MKMKYLLPLIIAIPVILVLGSGPKTNPKVENKVSWDSPQTKELFDRACADCHSNETNWPWYANIAPVSWKIIHSVNEGRSEMNVSTGKIGEMDDLAKLINRDKMPPRDYVLLHARAKLSRQEKQELIDGLVNTFGVSLENETSRRGSDDDDD